MHARSCNGIAAGLLLLAAGMAAAQAPKEGAGRDRKAMAGTWQALTYVLDGNETPAADLKEVRVVIDGDGKFKAQSAGTTFLAGTIKIDPARKPRAMDITYTEGDPKGQTALGIYELDGDTLRICRAAPGKARPTAFASKEGSGLTLMTFKRVKAGARKE